MDQDSPLTPHEGKHSPDAVHRLTARIRLDAHTRLDAARPSIDAILGGQWLGTAAELRALRALVDAATRKVAVCEVLEHAAGGEVAAA